jgi:DHA3 family macrolide efflux protein-like MFS transporter
MDNPQPHTAAWAGRFFAIWIGQQLSLIGSILAQFALVWWLTQTTGPATVLATAVAIATLPNIFLGPLLARWWTAGHAVLF